MRIELIKKYNELIKLSVDNIQIFKTGNFKFKEKEINKCKKDIDFYRLMKTIKNENS